MRIVTGLADFIEFGVYKHPVGINAGSHGNHDVKHPTPASWIMETGGGRGDSVEQLDEALVDFFVAHAEEISDLLFRPIESPSGKL